MEENKGERKEGAKPVKDPFRAGPKRPDAKTMSIKGNPTTDIWSGEKPVFLAQHPKLEGKLETAGLVWCMMCPASSAHHFSWSTVTLAR